MIAPNSEFKVTRADVAIHFFGWQTTSGCFHKIIDPVTIYGKVLEGIWPGNDDPTEWIEKLLHWGVTLRDFCAEQGIEIRPTLGGMAGQFLRDPRFYPKARRKVPAKINERVRENLPGNHYVLNIFPGPSNNFTAHYLDQHRAHHYHARTTPLPDSDHCYSYGRFLDCGGKAFDTFASNFSGLYCLDLSAPDRRPPFDWIGDNLNARFIYSSELPHLLDSGYTVSSVRAAWGSLQRDSGLPKYAAFAETQLDHYNDAAWLKPLLLATYGTLATRPMVRESIFRLAKSGTPVRVRTGHRGLTGLRVATTRKLEPPVAHLLQRGLIEAACRSDSIGLAQWLHSKGHAILSIYADAVMVEVNDDNPLPETIPEPWRLKRTLNHVQYINQQAFISDGMTKLPGVGRELLKYQQKTPGRAPRARWEAITNRQVKTPTGTRARRI